jgi:uncharacterized protein (DUF302 family)
MEQVSMGMKVCLHTDFASAQEQVTAALKTQGFGVLTEIDVQDTLKKKIDVDFRPYKILGACNPTLAHHALQTNGEVGLLLPCNVTLSAGEEGIVDVAIVDPLMMLGVIVSAELEAVAREAHQRLQAVIEALAE